jgi:CheY-like chemotaxis protein
MTIKKELYIVDDSADHRFMVKNIFTNFLPQYPVRFFDSAEELYHYLILQSSPDYAGNHPGLIILDMKMPAINGYHLLKLIRQTPDNEWTSWKRLPIVMMSSEAIAADISLCYEAGANSFLTKPVTLDEMRAILETTCSYWLENNCLPA